MLAARQWSDSDVRQEITDIAQDFEVSRLPDGSWPTHEREDLANRPHWCQYNGAAGAVVALRLLGSEFGGRNLTEDLPSIHANYIENPDHGYQPGLQIGEVGILAPAIYGGIDDSQLIKKLERAMAACVDHPARDITSGVTGMMHAALTLFERTEDERWLRHYVDGANSLLKMRLSNNAYDGLWRSESFGYVRHYFGACHGVAGNVGALLRGRAYLPEETIEQAVWSAVATLEAGLVDESATINWPVSKDPNGTKVLVHWCHGAAGIVSSLANCPSIDSGIDRRLDGLLIRAGNLVWKAGPLNKSPGICHGTPGNGYAFLALLRRFQDAMWLDRAQAFAMHSIDQRAKERRQYGQGRYTLWTGDGGLGVFLVQCLKLGVESVVPFPGLEVF